MIDERKKFHRLLSGEGPTGNIRPVLGIGYEKGKKDPAIYRAVKRLTKIEKIFDDILKEFHQQKTPAEIDEIKTQFFIEKKNDPVIGDAVNILMHDKDIDDPILLLTIEEEFKEYILAYIVNN